MKNIKILPLRKLEVLNFKPRSVLYNLDPLGIGTELSESLLSYVVRLAEAHHLYVGDLLKHVVFQGADRSYIIKKTQSSSAGIKFKRQLIGTGELTQDFYHALNFYTGRNDLNLLTLMSLKNFLSVLELLGNQKKFCPECYRTFKSEFDFYYEPIIWVIQDYKVCHIHKIKLRTKCHNCERVLPLIHNRERVGFCVYCNTQLDQIQNNSQSEICEEEMQISILIADFLNYCFSNNFNPDETYLSTIIQNLVDSVGDGCKKNYSEIMDINISSINAWLSYPKKIKLSTFVYICRVLGKLPSEMFAKRGTINNFSLQPIKKAKRRKQKVDRVMIEIELRYYAENTINPPPSLRQVGRTLNYDPTSIMQFFPELGELIKRKHKAYNLEKHNEKVRHRRLEIKKIVEQLVKNGQYPSEHQVEKYLENQFILLLERDYYKNLLKEMKVNRS